MTPRELLTWTWLQAHPNQPMPSGQAQVGLVIDTLEADAVAQYRAALRAEVEDLDLATDASEYVRRAVLRLIDKAQP